MNRYEVQQEVYRIDVYTVEAETPEEALEIAKAGTTEPYTGDEVTDSGRDWLVTQVEP